MIYNMLGKTELKVSAVGLGCENLEGKDYKTIESVVKAALECEINIFDVFMSEPNVRNNIGKALKGNRDKVMLQGHIGAAYINGQYQKTRDIKQSKFFFDDFMTRLSTDYVDIGMIHIVDTDEDFDAVFNGEIIEYALELKKQGRIKALGISSHAPLTALKAVKTGLLDVLMFSINPTYDLLPADINIDDLFIKETYDNDKLFGTDPIRAKLYSVCEQIGVGITVMKSLSAGVLLNAHMSPFGQAMTVPQCIHYALTRPGVSSVLVGCISPQQVYEAASYISKSDQEKDYAHILAQTPKYSMTGKCMYCNHCLPCPSKIDIASVTKYLDLALVSGDEIPATIIEHYRAMATSADDCIECGSCEPNCPFGVKIIENMRKAKALF